MGKNNVPTYSMARFNNDGSEIIIDNSHPVGTYLKWLGATPNAEEVLQEMLFNSVCVSASEFKIMEQDPNSIWYIHSGVLNNG